jgi:hypothetical protein
LSATCCHSVQEAFFSADLAKRDRGNKSAFQKLFLSYWIKTT